MYGGLEVKYGVQLSSHGWISKNLIFYLISVLSYKIRASNEGFLSSKEMS